MVAADVSTELAEVSHLLLNMQLELKIVYIIQNYFQDASKYV
jgi:hypothetical protein